MAEVAPPARRFAQRFAATDRGVRLARRLAVHQLDVWGYPPGGGLSYAAAVVVGELALNAVAEGRGPGPDFQLRLGMPGQAAALRIEVSDACAEARPWAEGGALGLLLVAAFTASWGVTDRAGGVGTTVWAEVGEG